MYKEIFNKIEKDNKNLYTFCMLKPDAIKRNIIGEIITMLEKKFTIIGMYLQRFTNEVAENFYGIHKERVFFKDLIENITSDNVCGILLKINNEDLNAITVLRDYMGVTNPSIAEKNTIRNIYGISIDENTIHGSDSRENFLKEIKIFFGINNE
ncbi:hypothetical protein AB836_02180 [Rickettsiales bacterium (ex Bugula neritina AB1)]|nr:hypothetical protein AB836_02180 [Rickettsiales bacterium (ex Bugula neritina AB1)]